MKRLRVLLVLGCTAALMVMGGASAAAAPAASHDRVEVDETFVDEEACAFPVEVHVTGTVVTNVTPQGTIEAFPRFRVTFTNLDTGASISTVSPAVVRAVSNGDGTATLFVTGLQGHLIVPGEGMVSGDVGRLVFIVDEETGEQIGDFVFMAGQFAFGPLPTLCDVLG
jgi:hypothetical protein